MKTFIEFVKLLDSLLHDELQKTNPDIHFLRYLDDSRSECLQKIVESGQ